MELINIILFALALNMDSFATGVAYGIRQIKLPIASLLIISLMSVAAISLSMLAGNVLANVISETIAPKLGGAILLFIGIWFFLQNLLTGQQTNDQSKTLFQVKIHSLGLVIQVLREPHRADLDCSGLITPKEAFLLGTALAMDAFGAGFAVSMLGFNLILTALVVGLGHILLTYLGLLVGQGLGIQFGRHFSFLPGCILIILALFKL